MTRVLVIYGTTDGHTCKVAAAAAETLRRRGVIVDAIEAGGQVVSPRDYDGVIVAASVHVGGYQRPVRRWVRAHAPDLGTRPTAFLSVCLGVLQNDPKVNADLTRILERFMRETAWRPPTTKIVAGAVLYTRYGWIKRRVMQRIVRKAGGDVDTTRDYEYTDWADLRRFVEAFVTSVDAPGQMCADGVR